MITSPRRSPAPPLCWWLLRDRARTRLRSSWRQITRPSRPGAELADLYVRVNDLDRLQERHAERSEQIARLLREAIEALIDHAEDADQASASRSGLPDNASPTEV